MGLCGKFTVIPYPAGLGTILEGWEGCDRLSWKAGWPWTLRHRPRFDITPEILTHTLALDLNTYH